MKVPQLRFKGFENDWEEKKISLAVVFNEIKRNPSVRVPELIEYTGFSEPPINRALKTLRETGLIVRVGAKKNGHWELAISNLQ